MGGEVFTCEAKGKTAQEAFTAAVEQAYYDHGHCGYTGSIAEKSSFIMIPLPEGRKAEEYADYLIDEGDSRIDDKWGDAGCFDLVNGKFYFFGWASC